MTLARLAVVVIPLVSHAARPIRACVGPGVDPQSCFRSRSSCQTAFSPETKKNVKWVVDLGTNSHSVRDQLLADASTSGPTNRERPRDPRHVGDRGVFMCLEREGTGTCSGKPCAEDGRRQIPRLAEARHGVRGDGCR